LNLFILFIFCLNLSISKY